MSLKNIIKFGDYIPPAPSSISCSAPDKVKDYDMANGNVMRILIRQDVKQITASFQLTKAQKLEFESHVHDGTEIDVNYDGKDIHMLVTAYQCVVNNVRIKGNYTISITLKESRR